MRCSDCKCPIDVPCVGEQTARFPWACGFMKQGGVPAQHVINRSLLAAGRELPVVEVPEPGEAEILAENAAAAQVLTLDQVLDLQPKVLECSFRKDKPKCGCQGKKRCEKFEVDVTEHDCLLCVRDGKNIPTQIIDNLEVDPDDPSEEAPVE